MKIICNIPRSRALPAAAAFAITLAFVLPGINSVPQHGDEGHYAITGAYYARKVARLDFSPVFRSTYDPGWNPQSDWATTQAEGSRFLYGLVLWATGESPPKAFFDFSTPVQPRNTLVAPGALFALRLTAILCACFGLALMALRLGWKSVGATGLVLLIPHVPPDLTRAWAEGPLLLCAGLCVLTFGTRWFGVACGLAATVKLTALGFWPLLLLRRANGGGRLARTLGVSSALLTWTLLTPQSWFAGGPVYLLIMLTVRKGYYQLQTQLVGRPGFEGFAGIFLPTRYLIPFELLAAYALIFGVRWLARRFGQSRRLRQTQPLIS